MEMIDDNKIYYVGFSDGSEIKSLNYICMYSEDENRTKEWCSAVKKKNPNSNITYLKMTGRMILDYNNMYSKEYKKCNDFEK
jgi:uncharacterized protein YfbU (UPF0304 family)